MRTITVNRRLFLPKSLHMVRILVAIARHDWTETGLGGPMRYSDALSFALSAARIIGYPNASAADPLIAKAAAQLVGDK